MKYLKERYGSLEDLEKRLPEFKGIRPVTANILLREHMVEGKPAAFKHS